MLMSAELKGCVTWFICFLDLLWVRYNCAKFHQCRCPHPWAAPKKPILNRVNTWNWVCHFEAETGTADEFTGNATNGKYVAVLDTFYCHRDMKTARREAVQIVLKRIRKMEQVLIYHIFLPTKSPLWSNGKINHAWTGKSILFFFFGGGGDKTC